MAGSAWGGLPSYEVAPHAGASERLNVIKFDENVRHLVQEKEDKLAGMIDERNGKPGEAFRFNFTGEGSVQELDNPYDMVFPGTNYGSSVSGDITPGTHDFSERWCFPKIIGEPVFCRGEEDIESAIGIKGALTQRMAYAFMRKRTSIALNAAVGTAHTGEIHDTLTEVTLPDHQKIDANDKGLTYEKILEAKFILDYWDVDPEDRVFFHSAEQLMNALQMIEVKNKDYDALKDLANGKVNRFLDFEFRRVSKSVLPQDANDDTIRQCVAWQKMGMGRVVWRESSGADIVRSPYHLTPVDMIKRWEKYNAVRLEEKRVVQIDCKEVKSPVIEAAAA